MKKLLNLKADGSLSFSIKNNLFQTVRRYDTFFTRPIFYIPIVISCAVIDIMGFFQIATATMSTDKLNRGIVVAAFSVAFEIAPLYIGYAICLKCYDLGKPVRKIVFKLSLISFILGIFANTIFRIMTMDMAYKKLNPDATTRITDEIARPLTVLMIILPIITSLMNIVIGCLSFDPLIFDIHRLAKKLNILYIRKQQLEACINEMEVDEIRKGEITKNGEENYNNKKEELMAIRTRLINYVSVCSATNEEGKQ